MIQYIYTHFLTMISITLFCCYEKGLYPYEYIDDWENSNETLLPEI